MAHPDLDALLSSLLPSAQRMLDEHGEFYPFGVTMQGEGAVAIVHASSDQEYPEAEAVVDGTLGALRERADEGRLKAVGLCVNVGIQKPGKDDDTDAIVTRLEHVDGEAVSVFLPYSKDDFGKTEYGELFATPEDPTVFAEGGEG